MPGIDVVGNPGLGSGNRAVADLAVSGDADLSGENHILADFGGTGKPDLRAEHGVFADGGSVPDLHQVIDLDIALDAGLANGGAIDARVGLYFHVVFDNGDSGLHDLVPALRSRARNRSRRRR